eukprot:GHRQ01000242.1.p1 GENE.GHRQ01000242.1~~GHRQ01000242.1.p1  ORF type:complete len:222 (+),score=83.11 GHRQ01000242.1:257-922(+)
MMMNKVAPAGVARGMGSSRLSAFSCSTQQQQRRVVVRFKSDNAPVYQKEEIPKKAENTKLSEEQLTEVFNKEEGNISPRMAELRADMGKAGSDLTTMQTFDGPGPETINGRLAMLAVATGLAGEYFTGMGLSEQTADHPLVVFASFVIISIATYVPIFKGYTRKEPFANHFLGLNWSPKAENWNGRLAMMGFTGMIFTEAISGVTTMHSLGLQPSSIPSLH